MKQSFLRVMMCALMIALFAAGARADGKLNSVSFKLTPTGNATCISTYNSAVTSGYGTQSGQLVDNKLTISKIFSTASQPVSAIRDTFFSPSIYPTAQSELGLGRNYDGPPFFPPSPTPTPTRPTYGTTNSFTLALTGNQTINEGDVFLARTETTAPSAQITITKLTVRRGGFGFPAAISSWRAVSGRVSVTSKSASALTLQLSDVVAQGASSSDLTIFNGTITATLNQAPTDIALSNARVIEKQAAGATVGTLSATDANVGDTFTYALVAGEADADNASFALSGNTLKTAEVFDAATKSSYSIRVRVTDKSGLTFEKAFAITVTSNNSAPVVQNVQLDTSQGAAVSGQLTGTDADGDALTFASSSDSAHGNLTLSANGAFSYAPSADFVGTDSFTFTANDGQATSAPATVTITVAQGNRAPVLRSATFAAIQNVGFSQQLVGSDADGDALTYRVAAGTLPAGLRLLGRGRIYGTPTQVETKIVTVKVSDGKGGVASARVTLKVAQGNRAPVLASVTFNATKGVAFSQQLAGSDADGDALAYRVKGGALPAGLRLLGRGLLYGTPTVAGTQIVTVRVTDGKGGLANARITLNVIDRTSVPSARDVRGDVVAGRNLVLNLSGTDPLGRGLSYRITREPRGLGTTGVAAIIRRGDQWMLAYRSSASFSGTDIIKFVAIARDGGRSVEATARIRVQAADNALSSANSAATPGGASSGSAPSGSAPSGGGS